MVKLREIIYDEDDLMKKLWNSKRLFPYITLACVVLALIFLGITNNTQIYNSWEYHLSVISLELTFLFSLTGIAAYILSMVKLRRDHEHSKVKTALNIYFAFSLFVFLVLVALTIAGNAGMWDDLSQLCYNDGSETFWYWAVNLGRGCRLFPSIALLGER